MQHDTQSPFAIADLTKAVSSGLVATTSVSIALNSSVRFPAVDEVLMGRDYFRRVPGNLTRRNAQRVR